MYDLAGYNSTKFANGKLADFKEFYVTITDPAYVPTYQLNNYVSTVTFAQSALNDVAADYSFTAFYSAFPNSTEPSQANVYIAKMNLEDFMTALGNYNSTVYTGITPIVYRRLLLTVTDHSYIPNWSTATNGQAKLNSGDPAVQAISNKYTIGHFHQLYPTSSLEHLRQTYLVTCNSLSLVSELTGYNNAIFPDTTEIGITVPAYTSVDYGHALSAPNDNQRYLDLIKAEQAWDITKGYANIKMSI